MLTIKFKIQLDDADEKFIQELQRQQSAAIRSVYKVGLLGADKPCARRLLRDRFSKKPNYEMLDSWFIESAVYSGLGSAKADLKLDVGNRTFGGKLNFISRAEDKISHQEFKIGRLNPIYLVGESPYLGNRKFSFDSIELVKFKPYRGKSIEIKLHSIGMNYRKLLTAAFDAANSKKLPITVSLTSNCICFSFEESELDISKTKKKKEIKTRYAGIDMNPNYVGVSVHDGSKMIASKLYALTELTTKAGSDSKLEFETFEIGNEIARFLNHFQVSKVFVEDLTKIRNSKPKRGKNFNRLVVNKWKREKLLRPIIKMFGRNCVAINAAYTSTIGNVLHPNLPDPIAASVAIASRGFEIIMTKRKKFYPELPDKKNIEDRWKKTDVPDYQTWIELHAWLRETGLKYRVDVPETSMFRIFSSRNSRVYQLDNFKYN